MKKTNSKKEENAVVLDYLSRGYVKSDMSKFGGKPIAQAIGTEQFTLLELAPKNGVNLEIQDTVYIGKGKRDKIYRVLGKLDFENLTATSRIELDYAIRDIVEANEEKFVEFFNTADSVSTRMHSLELIPGIGKKYMWDIIKVREQKPFESFEDISERLPGIKLNKNLGQNYLIDRNKRDQIIGFGNITKDDTVLEIGTGIGTLTIELAKRARKVIAIEQDPKICEILALRLKEEKIDNVELINDDALNVDFPKFNKIISNLPYQISSPITFKFLNYDFDLAILMYQKEFASRMNGKVATKDYSRLSAMLYFKCDVEKLTDVSNESFIPKPQIDSTVVRLTPKENTVTDEDFEIYSKFTKALFQHRNKKIKNALIDSRHIISDIDKKVLKNRLNDIDDDELQDYLKKRVVVLEPEEILFISQKLNPIFKE